MSSVWYGETMCMSKVKSTGHQCKNNAYYRSGAQFLCGVHSKKITDRIELPKNPNAKSDADKIIASRQELVRIQAIENKQHGLRGNVIVSKFRMMKHPDHFDGYMKIFPNYKHLNRKDGFGCPGLSPKSLGPINHGMIGIPPAVSLENYHQGAKVFKHELKNNDITEESKEHRINFYTDPIPHRHKFKEASNIPEFSVYYDTYGNERRYTYLESRYFYCHWYEKLAPNGEGYGKLQEYLENGTNIQIIGYDGYSVDTDLMTCYLDISRPFGHELVLYTMLVEPDSSKRPWNVFYESHKSIYDGVISGPNYD